MVMIIDGGMGRELKRLGAPFRQPEWSALALMEAPEFVSQAHHGFAEAGAELITTNSYAIVPIHIGANRFESHGLELARWAGSKARGVADVHCLQVAGSLPPALGSYQSGQFDAEAARSILSVLIEGLRPFVDLWLVETISSIEEAQLVCTMLHDDPCPLWLSFTINDAGPARLRSGESVEAAAALARDLGVEALLFNCSAPEVMDAAVKCAKETLGDAAIEIGVYANGFDENADNIPPNEGFTGMRSDLGPASYLTFARQWVASGASIVGGCCGIGPEHIAALSKDLN